MRSVESERQPWQGKVSDRPYVLFTQASLFDPSRAPAGKHTAWGYCHVPNGFTGNVTQVIENQVERFAPGFKDCIAARSVMGPADMERHNPNLIGGDIGGGAAYLSQMFLAPDRQPVSHAAGWRLSMFFFNTACIRRTWDVRILCRRSGAQAL